MVVLQEQLIITCNIRIKEIDMKIYHLKNILSFRQTDGYKKPSNKLLTYTIKLYSVKIFF